MILRFMQKRAGLFAMLAGILAYHAILPDSAPWWQKLGLGLAVLTPTYLLLFRYGITRVVRHNL